MCVSLTQDAIKEYLMHQQELRARERALLSAAYDRVANVLTCQLTDLFATSMLQDVADAVYW